MKINPDFLGSLWALLRVCGCSLRNAGNNVKFKEKLVALYKGRLPETENLSWKDIHCKGCLSEEPFAYCKRCDIKDCTSKKGYASCANAWSFPAR